MKYYKEKAFLLNMPSVIIEDLLTYDFWNDTEKMIVKNMFGNTNDRKSINYMITNGILNYEITQAHLHYRNALLKLHNFLKKTKNPMYKRLYKVII